MNNELKHYGVLGMKWGKRSGQNEPQSKPTGNRRMSNNELNARIRRLKLEQEFEKLTAPPATKSFLEKSADTTKSIATITSSAMTIYETINKVAGASKKSKK